MEDKPIFEDFLDAEVETVLLEYFWCWYDSIVSSPCSGVLFQRSQFKWVVLSGYHGDRM